MGNRFESGLFYSCLMIVIVNLTLNRSRRSRPYWTSAFLFGTLPATAEQSPV